MPTELFLKYVELNKSELSSKRVESYFNKMCNNFIPSLSQIVDINKYSNKLVYNADCFFIQNDGKDIGFLAIYTNNYFEKIAFISSISIVPEYQGMGISQKLIGFSIEHARKREMKYIKLEVNENNIKAIKLYKKNKFNIVLIDNNNFLMSRNI